MDIIEREISIQDEMLHYWEESCRAWCTKEGLEFTTGARLAHSISKSLIDTRRRSRPPADILPRPSRDEAAWRALSEWRHPQINLNLLQLAIVFKDYFLLEYLWDPMLLQEQDYRDDSSQLVNHPVHLHLRFISLSIINLHFIRDELLYEEGLVDLTPSRVLKSTGTQPDIAASGLPNASLLEFEISPLFHSVLMKISEKGSLLRQPQPMQMSALYDLNNVINVVQKLSGPMAQPSTVELVWAIATSTTSAQSIYFLGLAGRFDCIPPTHNEELLILLCQCTFTVTDAKLREERLYHLSRLFWEFYALQNVQIEKALRFLPTNGLEKTIRILQMEEALLSHPGSGRPVPLVAEVLKDQVACKSLQDLCVLTVLEAVRGDARKVWSLEQLPEPVKQLFHIPFQETYEELKAAEQGWISPSDFPRSEHHEA